MCVKSRYLWVLLVGSTMAVMTYTPSASSATVVLQATDDATIMMRNPDGQFGTAANLVVENTYGHPSHPPYWEQTALVRFNTSGLPVGARIVSASLHLYYYGWIDNDPAGRVLRCFQLTGDWNEATVTYNDQPPSAAVPSAAAVVPAAYGWMTWNVTDDVQRFVDGTHTDYGWKIVDDEVWGTYNIPWTMFHSKEAALVNRRPYLRVVTDEECSYIFEAVGGAGNEVAHSVKATSDGGFVVVGYTETYGPSGRNVFIAKLEAEGNCTWARVLGGSGDEEGCSVAETPSGEFVVVGYTTSAGNGQKDLLGCRFSNSGTHLGSRTWGGSYDDQAVAVIALADGQLCVAGSSNSFNVPHRHELVVMQLNATLTSYTRNVLGNPLLGRDYLGRCLAATSDGILVAGTVQGLFGQDLVAMAFGSNLGLQSAWQMTVSDGDESCNAVIRTSAGAFAYAGSVAGGSDESGFLLTLDGNMNHLWNRVWSPDCGWSAPARSVCETADGHLAVVGEVLRQNSPPTVPPTYNRDLSLLIWDSAGLLLQSRSYGSDGNADESGSCVAAYSDRSVVAVGYTDGFGGGQHDMLMAKYDRAGRTCRPDWGGPTGMASSWSRTAIDPIGNLQSGTTSSWSPEVQVCYPSVMDQCASESIVVQPDGFGDVPTIQDAIDVANNGATIELTDGVFTGPGNRDINYGGKVLTIRSQGGPENCTIDVRARRIIPHRAFTFSSGETRCAVLEGVSIIGGDMFSSGGCGGAILCDGSSPTIRTCWIKGDSAYLDGGAVYCGNAAGPLLESCVISGNSAGHDGGGLYIALGCAVEIERCTISGNWAGHYGGGIFGGCIPKRSILWGSSAGSGIGDEWYGDGAALIANFCDDIQQAGLDGFGPWAIYGPLGPNIDAYPCFCDPAGCGAAPAAAGDYHLSPLSLCAPDHQPQCGLIGALGVGACVPACAGDSNCDGMVNWRDIDYFVAAMNDDCVAWGAVFAPALPSCPFANNDVNADGTVNWCDIDAFVAVMNTICP